MIQINCNKKIKFLILAVLLRRQITMLKLLKQRVKYQVLTVVDNKIPNISSLVKKQI